MSGAHCKPNVDKNCARTTTKSKGIGSVPLGLTEEQWLCIFIEFDSDEDGRLSQEEVKNGFKTLGLSPLSKQTFASLSQVDENGNKYIGRDKIGELAKYVVERGYTIKL